MAFFLILLHFLAFVSFSDAQCDSLSDRQCKLNDDCELVKSSGKSECVSSAGDCSVWKQQGQCNKNKKVCSWDKKGKKCLDLSSQCEKIKKRKGCVKIQCEWSRIDNKCSPPQVPSPGAQPVVDPEIAKLQKKLDEAEKQRDTCLADKAENVAYVAKFKEASKHLTMEVPPKDVPAKYRKFVGAIREAFGLNYGVALDYQVDGNTITIDDDASLKSFLIWVQLNSKKSKSDPFSVRVTPNTPSPTSDPTNMPTSDPTMPPTEAPTNDPTQEPTPNPTESPTLTPTAHPTLEPTHVPTNIPTLHPTRHPTLAKCNGYHCTHHYDVRHEYTFVVGNQWWRRQTEAKYCTIPDLNYWNSNRYVVLLGKGLSLEVCDKVARGLGGDCSLGIICPENHWCGKQGSRQGMAMIACRTDDGSPVTETSWHEKVGACGILGWDEGVDRNTGGLRNYQWLPYPQNKITEERYIPIMMCGCQKDRYCPEYNKRQG